MGSNELTSKLPFFRVVIDSSDQHDDDHTEKDGRAFDPGRAVFLVLHLLVIIYTCFILGFGRLN